MATPTVPLTFSEGFSFRQARTGDVCMQFSSVSTSRRWEGLFKLASLLAVREVAGLAGSVDKGKSWQEQ